MYCAWAWVMPGPNLVPSVVPKLNPKTSPGATPSRSRLVSYSTPPVRTSGSSRRTALIDPEKIGVLMAQNRGAIGDVFTNEAEAIVWLDGRQRR